MPDRETLLIVEDNNDLRNGLKEILAFEGFNILEASNGKEALEQMSAVNPDLILSDITMPEMDGYEFFDAVRGRTEGITIPFIFLTARGERDEVMRGKNLGAEDYLVKPLTRSELIAAVEAKLTRFRQLQLAQLHQAYQASLTLLANAIELRDNYTRGHIERVTEYTMLLAEHVGFHGKRLEELRFGAILHDIGKILVDESTWMKPGPLSKKERQEVNRHPVEGAQMIKDIAYLAPAMQCIRFHHERWDGKGYPDGLAGEAIPLEARIIAVADSFDAMTTDRPYHRAMSLEESLEEIIQNSGKQFDPSIVAVFLQIWEVGKIQKIAVKWRRDEKPAIEQISV